jgi:hypothetical protein
MREEVELLFRNNPRAGIKFLRPLLVASSINSILLTMLDAWSLCHADHPGCTTSLSGLWVASQAVLHVSQFPFRIILLRRLQRMRDIPSDATTAMHLVELNRSWQWDVNRRLGAANLVWFVAGLVVGYRTSTRECGLRGLIYLHSLFFVLRCGSTLAWFARCFAADFPSSSISAIFRRSTARAMITELPRVRFEAQPAEGAGGGFQSTACVICLADYHQGEEVLKLHCGHSFHESCRECLSHLVPISAPPDRPITPCIRPPLPPRALQLPASPRRQPR